MKMPNGAMDVARKCENEDALIVTVYADTRSKLEAAIRDGSFLQVQYALTDFAEVEDVQCPFDGAVTLYWHGTDAWWVCPMCKHMAQEQIGPDDVNDPDADRQYALEND